MPAMSNKMRDSDVIGLVLASFQHELRRPQRGWLASLLFRPPDMPTIGYAQQYAEVDDRGCVSGHPMSVWRLTHEAIEHLGASFVVPAPDMTVARARRRFEFAYFGFTLPDESGYGVTGSQFGPLCGHGGRYKICIHESVPRIEMEGGWIS
jgi:hypothetical protein